MRNWFLALGKSFEAPAVHQENVQPVVVVIVVESDSATSCFKQIFIFAFAAENCFCVATGFASDVDKTDADFFLWWRILIRISQRRQGLIQMKRTRKSEDALQRQDKSGTA